MKVKLALPRDPLVAVVTASLLLSLSYGVGKTFGLSTWLNQSGPVLLFAVCAWAAYALVRSDVHSLWTPLPWFLAACAVYFGFGPLIYHFGSEASIAFIDRFYAVDEQTLARTNLLNAVGIALVLGGLLVGRKLFPRTGPDETRNLDDRLIRRLLFVFLAIGVSVELFFLLPYRLGLLSWTLPGAIQFLASLSKVAIILLFVLVSRGYGRYRLFLYGLIAFELILALMSFSKLEVIQVFIAVALGWYLVHPNIRGLVIGSVLVVLLYVFILSPFVTFGRLAFSALGVGTVSEVAEVVEEFGKSGRDDLAGLLPGVQNWWTRFSYSNAQAFAMDDYDHGKGGETVRLALYAFVPRLLFPDKPLMTPGREFTAAVLGYDSETHTAPGIFAEAYWNGGWTLVVVVCLYVGMVFAGFAAFVNRTIGANRYEYLPIVLIGIGMGYTPDSWFAATYVGTLAQAFGLYVVLRLLLLALR